MKLLMDYKNEELVELNDEEKQSLFLLECAERGVPLPDATPAYIKEPKERDENKPDLTTYSIGGRYSSDKFHFMTLEEAQAVADLIKSNAVSVQSGYSDDGAHLDGGTVEVEVHTNNTYSKDKYESVKAQIADFKQDKSKVTNNNSRRAEIIKKQESVMTEINNAIWDANKNVTRLAELKRIFEQYLTMANKDREVAVRFLLNAHYSEVTEYEDDMLPQIGLTREDIEKYNKNSEAKDEEN